MNLLLNLLSFALGGILIYRIYMYMIPEIQREVAEMLLSVLR